MPAGMTTPTLTDRVSTAPSQPGAERAEAEVALQHVGEEDKDREHSGISQQQRRQGPAAASQTGQRQQRGGRVPLPSDEHPEEHQTGDCGQDRQGLEIDSGQPGDEEQQPRQSESRADDVHRLLVASALAGHGPGTKDDW